MRSPSRAWRPNGRLLAALCCAVLGACAADRVTGVRAAVPSAAEATRPVAAPSLRSPACGFSVVAIDDRRDGDSLGEVARTRVDGEGFAEWFRGGVAAVPGHVATGGEVQLRLELLKTYIRSLATLKSANLVVRVTFTSARRESRSLVLRGANQSMNWNSSQAEIQEAFDGARSDLQAQLLKSLADYCAS